MNRKRGTRDTPAITYPIRSRPDRTTSTEVNEDDPQEQYTDCEELNDDVESASLREIRLLREMMVSMQTNINSKIDTMVGDIKEDVGQIKSQLEKYNGRFEEVQERIGSVEDKMESLECVGEEFNVFKKEWDSTLSQVNLEACRARKNNIIFKGIPGRDNDPKKAMECFKNLCVEKLKMPSEWVRQVDVNEAYRFPPKGGNGNWPLFISLAKSRHREDLYRSAFNLKDTGIIMTNDLAPCLIKKRKDLTKTYLDLRKAPYNYRTHFRDSPFDVWIEFLKPDATKWEVWKGKI